MRIKNQTFEESDTVDLDGNAFEGCTFNNSRMVFRALAAVSFVNCRFKDVRWEFNGPAALTMMFIKTLTESAGDYGLGLLVNTFPALKDSLKPEVVAKLSGGASSG